MRQKKNLLNRIEAHTRTRPLLVSKKNTDPVILQKEHLFTYIFHTNTAGDPIGMKLNRPIL